LAEVSGVRLAAGFPETRPAAVPKTLFSLMVLATFLICPANLTILR